MYRIFHVSLLIISYLLSNIKCFTTNIYDRNSLHNCSSVLCSHDKLTNIYNNSKFILAELENILYDIRDEKDAHKSEHEQGNALDLEIKFPNSKDYEDLSYLIQDEENGNERNFAEPVPYIIISRIDDDDFEKSILNNTTDRLDNSDIRDLTGEEQMDVAFSRIRDLDEQQKRFTEEKRKFNLKKYLR
ncbi:hypothetical protein, conserved [Plasmodium gonderi]|uniref:Uncharacterized protein n=1 Tax=Plasmodium gonderi TaxID=77519 RepID=A0A1Y1JQJ7_PLAGO|nr:hypothetical protein, conserved [Plasmodium gonderi]GAW83527.1 hypothetical protein, conserved [Plasmodium gonderi]